MTDSGRSISDLNSVLLDSYLRDKNLNFANIIASNMDCRLGIIGTYEHSSGQLKKLKYINGNFETADITETDTPYYGLSPVIDNKKIIDEISKLHFQTAQGVNDFIQKNLECFMLHASQADKLPAFSRYLVLSYAYNFSVSFIYDEDLKDKLSTFVESDSTHTILAVQNDHIISIKGCPTNDLLNALNGIHFQNCDGLWAKADTGLTIEEIYQDTLNIKYADGHVFYSGTMFRPIEFTVSPYLFENSNTETIICKFEKTSYATVFALDHDLSAHPLLKGGDEETIQKIFRNENHLIFKLNEKLKNCDSTPTRLIAINEFLSKCFNVNQIGVSANITTSDDYLLMGVRNNNSIDQNCLYPGVNGNAEIADMNVSFYNWNATVVDFPAIELIGRNIRFDSEIQREASEELQIEADVKCFKTCALIISGFCPPEENFYKQGNLHRLHFNILYDYQSDKTLLELMHSGENANESFENQGFVGIRINVYDGLFKRIKSAIGSLLCKVIENKDLWESVLLLVVAISQLITLGNSKYSMSDWIQLILAILLICVDYYKLKLWIKCCYLRKHDCITLNINTNRGYKKIDNNIKRIIPKDYHPVAAASLLYKIEEKIRDSFNK